MKLTIIWQYPEERYGETHKRIYHNIDPKLISVVDRQFCFDITDDDISYTISYPLDHIISIRWEENE